MVVPQFATVFRDFKSDLPMVTRAIIAFSRVIVPILGYAFVACAAVAVLMLVIGRRRRRWILNRLPLFGALWRYSGLAEMACLLRILIASDVPLPEALRLTADGIGDADLTPGCRQAAARVESGTSLADAVRGLAQFDPTTRPMFAWGESHAALAEASDTIGQTAIGRVQLRAELLRTVLPPGVFLGVALVLLYIMALFMPLVALITNLTGGSGRVGPITSYPPVSPPTPFAVLAIEILLIVAPLVICGWLVSIVARMQRSDERPMFARFVPWLTAALCFFGVLVLVTSIGTRNPDVALIGAVGSLSLLALFSAWVIYLDRSPYVKPVESLRTIAEGVFYGLGLVVVTVLLFAINPFVGICWFALVFYFGAFAFRYRQSQRRALLDLMSRAADRGMPLRRPFARSASLRGAGSAAATRGWPNRWRRAIRQRRPLPEIAAHCRRRVSWPRDWERRPVRSEQRCARRHPAERPSPQR